jgi:glutathione synthase
MIGLDAFIYAADESICALAHRPRRPSTPTTPSCWPTSTTDAERERIAVADLDVLLLRSDPADEIGKRPWAPTSALLFAQLAAQRRVIVLNDPTHLAYATNKTYFQGFPAEVRPVTCISYDPKAIREFVDTQQGGCVIKPLQGSGGRNVFVVMPGEDANINQIIEAVTRDGYAIAQEYLPEAREGDLRLLTLNGRPLQVDGRYACFRRRATAATRAATSPPAAASSWPSPTSAPCGWPRWWRRS